VALPVAPPLHKTEVPVMEAVKLAGWVIRIEVVTVTPNESVTVTV
jgi:hypothetical protein